MSDPSTLEEERRKFMRFNVSSLTKVKFRTDLLREPLQLVTLAEGGCGFFDLSGQPLIQIPKRVVTHLSFERVTRGEIELQGNLIYMKSVKKADREVVFGGIEFIPAHRGRLKGIIEHLEQLLAEQKINLA